MKTLTLILSKIKYHKKQDFFLYLFFLLSFQIILATNLLIYLENSHWLDIQTKWGVYKTPKFLEDALLQTNQQLLEKYQFDYHLFWLLITIIFFALLLFFIIYQRNEVIAAFNLGLSKMRTIGQLFLEWLLLLVAAYVTIFVIVLFFNHSLSTFANELNEKNFQEAIIESTNINQSSTSSALSDSEPIILPFNIQNIFVTTSGTIDIPLNFFIKVINQCFLTLLFILTSLTFLIIWPLSLTITKRL